MQIKQKPEDFKVEELTVWDGREGGDYAFYRLEKRGWIRGRWDWSAS